VAENRRVVLEHNALRERVREFRGALTAVLRHAQRCGVCTRPATYARALTVICDECAADPTLEGLPVGKEACLLTQAADVRTALAALGKL
jgi:hypothetical protein